MATALRRCRDAEIAWEQRCEIDLADPKTRRESNGWGLRVNLEGRLGWAWADVSETPEGLLERALGDARASSNEGLIFAHGLPFAPHASAGDPLALEPYLEQLTRLVSRAQFLLPSLVKDRQTRIRAGLRWQMLNLVTRAGERTAQRVNFQLTVDTPDSPWLVSALSTTTLPETPSELLCELAWQAAHSGELLSIGEGERPVILNSPASCALITDMVNTHFDGARILQSAEAAAPLGEEWLSQQITLQDDGTLAGGVGSVPFDGEGQPRRPVSLIEQGVVLHHLADRFCARALGVEAAGLAVRDWGQPPRPGYSNLSLLSGTSSLAELSREVKDAILIDRLVPCNAPNETDEFCRLAQTAFVLRNGRPAARLAPFLLRGKYHHLLGKDLLGLGFERGWAGRAVAPPLALKKAHIEPARNATAHSEAPTAWW